MDDLQKDYRLGWLFSLIGAIVGIGGNIGVFLISYGPMMIAEEAKGGGCGVIVEYFLPAYTDIGILGGVLWLIAFYGFINKRKWANSTAILGSVFALQASFWPMIPTLDGGLFPYYSLIFIPNVILYFLYNRYTNKYPWSRVLLGLLTGIALVLASMNGVAGTNRMMVFGWPVFVMTQRLTWIAAIGWGFVTFSLLTKPKKLTRIVGIGAGLLEIIIGFPMAIASSISFGKISMFFMAPVVSLSLIVIIFWPGLWERLINPPE